MIYDLIIKNGHVVDPAAGIDTVGNVGFFNGLSCGLVPDDAQAPATRVIDASGLYVFPGLVDFHTHVARRISSICLDPDWFLADGVTACADAGSVCFSVLPLPAEARRCSATFCLAIRCAAARFCCVLAYQ